MVSQSCNTDTENFLVSSLTDTKIKLKKINKSDACMKNQRKQDKILQTNFYVSSSTETKITLKKIKSIDTFRSVGQKLSRPPIPFVLYMYRKELERRRVNSAHLSQSKIILTENLVNNTVKDIHDSLDNGGIGKIFKNEMKVLSREVIYVKKLQHRIQRMERRARKNKQHQKSKVDKINGLMEKIQQDRLEIVDDQKAKQDEDMLK